MMRRVSRVLGATLVGVDGIPVEVEARLSSQLPAVDVVGLPEAAVRESVSRVRAAIASAGERFPDLRVTVNLAPAGVRKSGAALDLPIAVAILGAGGAIPEDAASGRCLIGELSLDGRVRPVRGCLALAEGAGTAGCRTVIVPASNGPEAALARGIDVRGCASLAELLAALRGAGALERVEPREAEEAPDASGLAEIRGQMSAKRALEVAAAGGHGLLFRGPPGAGKSLLARCLPALLPPLDPDERVEVARIHGVAFGSASTPQTSRRPFRAPHHATSSAGLLGGGRPVRPGEVSLAHRGVLFLDELAEFDRRALQSLRQVLEEGRVHLARASGSYTFPAAFQLIAAANPCPCGWRFSDVRDCRCDDAAVARYAARLSGPLLDRIDLHVNVAAVSWKALASPASGEPSVEERRARIDRAREIQRARNAGGAWTNAALPPGQLAEVAGLDGEGTRLLRTAVDRLGLSARAVHRTLRVARTVADLAGNRDGLLGADVAEALGYRAEWSRRE